MAKAIVSFATRPGRGSEGGVGWAFASQAAEWAFAHGEELLVVIDERDLGDVLQALEVMGPAGRNVRLVPVSVPTRLLQKYGDSRSRQTYLGWSLRARRQVAKFVADGVVDLVHQVTFATTSLPHVLPVNKGARTVWGPVMVPSNPVYAQDSGPTPLESAGVWGLRHIGRLHARNVDTVIATNEFTQNWLSSDKTILEPNIVVDVTDLHGVVQEDDLLTTSGLLIDRKRPWLAVQAMLDPGLAEYRLNLIGDGPLRPALERLVQDENLGSRVKFLGRLKHQDALRSVAAARVLLHPAVREGASWVVGEAAALGVPAVAFRGTGADSTIVLSRNGGRVVDPQTDSLSGSLAEGVADVMSRSRPAPTDRWSKNRIPGLFDTWWSEHE